MSIYEIKLNLKNKIFKLLIILFIFYLSLNFGNNSIAMEKNLLDENKQALSSILLNIDGNSSYHSNLKSAIEAVQIGEEAVIELTDNIEVDSQIKILSGQKIIIDGKSNYTISIGKNSNNEWYTGKIFYIETNGSLTLKDIVIDGKNNWTLNETYYNEALNAGTRIADTNAFVTSEDSAPNRTDWFVQNSGNLQITNSTIKNFFSNKGYGLFYGPKGSNITIETSTITHCASTSSGVVASITGKNSIINIEKGTIIDDNYVGSNGGIFKIYTESIVTMNGGEIKNTKGVNSNGNVAMMYGATFILNDGTIKNNSSVCGKNNGRNAPIYVHSGGKFVMNGGVIEENHGTSSGGIDVAGHSNASIELNGGVIQKNEVIENYIERNDLYIGNDYNLEIDKDMTINGFAYIYGDLINNGNINGWVSLNMVGSDDEIALSGTGTVDGDVVIYHKTGIFPKVSDAVKVTGDVVYCDPTYQVIVALVYNGGVNEKGRNYRLIAVDINQVPVIPEPTREGHTLAGWYTDEKLTKKYESTVIDTKRTILYADWTVNSYIISWEVDGVKTSSEELDYGEKITVPKENPTKEGYTFIGWSNYVDGMTTKSEDTTFKALWKINEYTVKFDSRGGTIVADVIGEYGTTINKPEDPVSSSGMTFAGWYTDEELTNLYNFNEPLKDEITLYAKWITQESKETLVGESQTENTTQQTNTTDNKNIVNNSNNPSTGDNIFRYVIMFVISGIAIGVSFVTVKKISKDSR